MPCFEFGFLLSRLSCVEFKDFQGLNRSVFYMFLITFCVCVCVCSFSAVGAYICYGAFSGFRTVYTR